MTVRVLFFGHFRDVAEGLTVELPEPADVATLADALAARDPRLANLLARTRPAVDAEFADASTPLADGVEVAFLPPMSGG